MQIQTKLKLELLVAKEKEPAVQGLMMAAQQRLQFVLNMAIVSVHPTNLVGQNVDQVLGQVELQIPGQ